MEDEVLDFIKRRWSNSDHWLDGNCYWFSYILHNRFPQLEIFYLPIKGHFVVGDSHTKEFYDWTGKLELDEEPILFSELLYEDPVWYARLLKNCRD